MEDEEIKCKECPNARHGFDRNASHNAGRYVCECESFVCPSEQLRQRVAELETQLAKNNPLLDEAADAIDKLTSERDALKKEVAHWKNNHETEVRRARILKERTDMPIERVQAYEQWGKDQAERDALKQQREELLAALERSLESFEYIAKYGNSCGHSQLRIPDLKAAIASVKEK